MAFSRSSDPPSRAHSLASDGAFVYLLTDRGLFKVGSGYGGTVKGRVYRHRPDFDPSPAWIGFAGGALYYRSTSEEDDGADGATAAEGSKLEVCQVL